MSSSFSGYKIQRLNFALFMSVFATLIMALGMTQVSYICSTIAFIAFIPFFKFNRKKRFDKSVKVLLLLLTFYNFWLAFNMLFAQSSLSIPIILLSPNFLQAVLVFCFLFFDEYYFPQIVVQARKLLPLVILCFAFERTLPIVYAFFLFAFREMIICKYWNRWLVWLMLVICGFFYFVTGFRFNGLALLVLFILYVVVEILPKLKKIVWIGSVLLPLVFGIVLFIFDVSLFDLSETSDNELMADSRSALYVEVSESLVGGNQLWLGTGVLGGVATGWFLMNNDNTVGKDGKRQFIETNILDLIRRGGLVYLLLYFVLVGIVSFRSLKAKNKILQNIGIMLTTIFYFSLVDIPVFMEPVTMTYFIFISIAASVKLRQMDDKNMCNWLY